jgi:hypothetical protein
MAGACFWDSFIAGACFWDSFIAAARFWDSFIAGAVNLCCMARAKLNEACCGVRVHQKRPHFANLEAAGDLAAPRKFTDGQKLTTDG